MLMLPTQEQIEAEVQLLPLNEPFFKLDPPDRVRFAYAAAGMLRRRYGAAGITVETVALQVLHMAEGEGEEFAKFKRQGVKSMGMDGMSFSFDGTNISPEVVAFMELQARQETDGGEGPPLFGRMI